MIAFWYYIYKYQLLPSYILKALQYCPIKLASDACLGGRFHNFRAITDLWLLEEKICITLTNSRGWVMHICVSKISITGSDNGFAPSRRQWWNIVNWTLTNKLQWNFSRHSNIFFQNKANLRDLIAATGLVISNWIQIVNFSARVTVKFDRWSCNTIGHLFYATSSFVHHFVAIGEFKLQLQSGNAQSGSNSTIFRGVRPWNLTDDLAKQ